MKKFKILKFRSALKSIPELSVVELVPASYDLTKINGDADTGKVYGKASPTHFQVNSEVELDEARIKSINITVQDEQGKDKIVPIRVYN